MGVELVRDDGLAQAAIFRLNRRVDSFELTHCKDSSICKVPLTDVATVRLGSEPCVKHELAQLGRARKGSQLDSSCSLLELADGRCLAFRFLHRTKEGSEARAKEFTV